MNSESKPKNPHTSLIRFWVSWEEPEDDDHPLDYRPLTEPPDSRVLHWWCSGLGDDYYTMCAVIEAIDKADARKGIEASWTWRGGEWRFFDEVDADWMPNAGRFPVRS